jgi:hypothetical protein
MERSCFIPLLSPLKLPGAKGKYPHSTKEFAVRAKTGQPQGIGVGLSVDQKQVRLDVALAIASPIAAQVMVVTPLIQRLVASQSDQNRHQIGIQCDPVPALGLPLVIAFEGR